MATKRTKPTKAAAEEKYLYGEEDLTPHANAVGIAPEDEEAMEDFRNRILDAVNGQEEEEWNTLPDDTKEWSNLANKERLDESKAKAAEKKKAAADGKDLNDMKAAAKAKAAKKKKTAPGEVGVVYRSTTGAFGLFQIVIDAEPNGVTIDECVAEANRRKIVSGNMNSRVKQVLRECAIKTGYRSFTTLSYDEETKKFTVNKDVVNLKEYPKSDFATAGGGATAKAPPKKVAPKTAPTKKAAPAKVPPAKPVKKAPPAPTKKVVAKKVVAKKVVKRNGLEV